MAKKRTRPKADAEAKKIRAKGSRAQHDREDE
jgi:hypothetical protein